MIHPPSDAVRLTLHHLRQEELEAQAARMRLVQQASSPGAIARFSARASRLVRLAGKRAALDSLPAVPQRDGLWWRIALMAGRR